MLDTVALTLSQDKFVVFEHEQFSPSAGLVYNPDRRGVIRCYRNPTSKELKQGLYVPRLTLTGRPRNTTLRIELSVPKFLFGNNFDELTENDFADVVKKLENTLKDIGVRTYSGAIESAQVSLIHYGKNIVFSDYTTPATYIREVNNSDISQQLDFNQTDFRNGGHSIKFRANSFEFALYDKVKDLQKAKISNKRSEEKENEVQLSLLDFIEQKHKAYVAPFEVLRMEARLNNRKRIRDTFIKIGYPDIDLTFQNLFKTEIARQVNLFFLDTIIENHIYLADSKLTNAQYFSELHRVYPEYSLSKKNQLLGARVLIKELGIKGYRQLLSVNGASAWYRHKKLLKASELPRNRGDPIGRLIREVTAFTPIKLHDYPQFQL